MVESQVELQAIAVATAPILDTPGTFVIFLNLVIQGQTKRCVRIMESLQVVLVNVHATVPHFTEGCIASVSPGISVYIVKKSLYRIVSIPTMWKGKQTTRTTCRFWVGLKYCKIHLVIRGKQTLKKMILFLCMIRDRHENVLVKRFGNHLAKTQH